MLFMIGKLIVGTSSVASPKGVGGFENLVCLSHRGGGVWGEGLCPTPQFRKFEKMKPILPSFHAI